MAQTDHIYMWSLTKLMATGINDFFHRLVRQGGSLYLRPDGSKENSEYRGWVESAIIERAFLIDLTLYRSLMLLNWVPAISLHTLMIACNRFFCFTESDPCQQTKQKVRTDSIKQE